MAELLEKSGIRLGASAENRDDAIRQVGALLVEIGAVAPEYVDGMLEREESVSTFVGEAVAIPHGTNAAREHVRRTALAVVQFPGGVDWDGQRVQLCVGIAAQGSEQVQILSSLAHTLLDAEKAAELREASDPDTILRILTATEEEAVQ